MLRRNDLSSTRYRATKTNCWNCFTRSKGVRGCCPESVYSSCLDRRRLRGSPSLVGRWIAKDEIPSARIQCALRPGVQIPLPARMFADLTLSAPDENHGERFKKGARG